jgi:ankyrin repeat protein
MVRLLRRRGARLDARVRDDGTTALHAAAQMVATAEMAEAVLGDARGAAVDLDAKYGYTPLFFACLFGRTHCAAALLARGANVNATIREAPEALGVNGLTPITAAIQAGSAELITLLAANGANVTGEVRDGLTVLGFAIVNGCQFDIVDALCRAGADPNAPMGAGPLRGETPLTLALRTPGQTPAAGNAIEAAMWLTERVNVVNWLMNNGADASQAGPDGQTPRQIARALGEAGAMFDAALQRG